ncbi:MAG: DoxX family protein [Opitutaceae bacterium]
MPSILQKLRVTTPATSVVLIRLMVGGVFLSEGIQKFLFVDQLGAGRFARLGLPSPQVLGPLVGGFEIVCGALVLIGLFTRLASLPLLVIIGTAIVTTKLPMLAGDGFWKAAHEGRADYAMLLGLLFLLVVGAGRWSLDTREATNPKSP